MEPYYINLYEHGIKGRPRSTRAHADKDAGEALAAFRMRRVALLVVRRK